MMRVPHASCRSSAGAVGLAVFCAWLMIASSVRAAVSAAERFALVDLYDATNFGAGWTIKTNWNMRDPCEDKWYGVTCNADGTSVT